MNNIQLIKHAIYLIKNKGKCDEDSPIQKCTQCFQPLIRGCIMDKALDRAKKYINNLPTNSDILNNLLEI